MPRRASAAVNARAAAAAEPLIPSPRSSSTESAEIGGDSIPRNQGFQPGRRAACVEVPLVADDASRNAADSPGRDVAGERLEVGGGECRVAVTDEKEVATPDPAGELSFAENVRAKAISRA